MVDITLQLDGELQLAAENVLDGDENLVDLAMASLVREIATRQKRNQFISTAISARNKAREAGRYHDAKSVLDKLQEILDTKDKI